MFALFSLPFYFIGIAVQILCIVHVLKTRRREWIYILLFLPLAGAVVYFIMELWPEINRGEFGKNLTRVFLPHQKIREMQRKLKVSDTITNKLNLADAYAEQKQYGQAIELVEACLKDPYINQSAVTLQLGRLLFGAQRYTEALHCLEQSKAVSNGKFTRSEDELLYTRALDYNGQLNTAEEEYKRIIRVHHSMEAMYHYG
ncbi:MAG: hypothetical protein EOP55_18050, partial [Sphingobacteriales bacterium]